MLRMPKFPFHFALLTLFGSLPRRLGVFAFATTVLTALAVTWISVNSIHGFLRGKIDQKFPAILHETAEKLDRWYGQRLEDVETLSKGGILVDTLGDVRKTGGAGARAHREVRQYLGYVLESFPEYDAFFVRDRWGKLTLGAGESLEAMDAFVRHLPGAGPSVGDIERLGESRIQLVSASVSNRRGQIVGSLHARLRLEHMDELLTSRDLGTSGEIYLVGRDGHHLTASATHTPWDRYARLLPGEDVEPTVLEYTKSTGERMVGTSVRVDRFGWVLVVEERYDDAFAPAVALIHRTVAINLAIVLFFGLVAYRIAISITMPIEALSAAVQRVSAGETDAFVPPTPNRDDEVGILTRGFNEMTRNLHQNRLELLKSRRETEEANDQLREQNEELRRANEMLEQLSITDGLTKLHNHRYFQDCLTHETKRANRSKEPLTLLLIDVDDFKQLNDRHGHVAGDKALRHLATVMNQTVRETDLLARYGGEEFVVLAPRTDLTGAITLGETIRTRLAASRFVLEGLRRAVPITVSIGVAVYRGDRDAIFAEADRALYSAKDSGKDCVKGAGDEEPAPPVRRRLRSRRSRKGR